jgi:pimeloyl-ACP methyl ester carboxylesterase
VEEAALPKATVGDITIQYETYGEGETLLLIAGLGACARVWFRQIPYLSRSYQVLAFDNRGAGASDKPDAPYSMEMLAGDTAGLLDELGIGKAHVYGVSMGGMIAQELALRHPQRVTSLILGCTTCGGDQRILPSTDTIAFLLDADRWERLAPDERTRASLPFNLSQAFIEGNPELIEEYVAMVAANSPPPYAFVRQREAVTAHDTCDRLPLISAPTLVVSGSADRQVPVENSRLLASRIPSAELVILEGMGHGFFIEAAEEASRAILDFLARHKRPA